MDIKLNLVEHFDQLKNPGDASEYTKDNRIYIVWVCPKCGDQTASKTGHNWNRKTETLSPSIVHNVKLGGCGYHGWLKNGVFTEC